MYLHNIHYLHHDINIYVCFCYIYRASKNFASYSKNLLKGKRWLSIVSQLKWFPSHFLHIQNRSLQDKSEDDHLVSHQDFKLGLTLEKSLDTALTAIRSDPARSHSRIQGSEPLLKMNSFFFRVIIISYH